MISNSKVWQEGGDPMRGLERIGQQQAAAETTDSRSFLDEFQTSANEIRG
jgi:hypothetical protein